MSILNILSTATEVIPADSVTRAPIKALELLDMFAPENKEMIHQFFGNIISEIISFAANMLLAIAIYLIGKWLLKRAIRLMDVAFENREVEVSVRSFLRSATKIVFYIILILTVIQILGINTTSLVAMLASAGLAIGMALSGTLQNFAGGIMVLFLKPYKVGDYITSQDKSGTVKEIMLFTTVLETPDRHTIFVPNSAISSSIIDNATFSNVRRLDWAVGITYGDSVADVRKIAMEIFAEDPRILNNPENPAQQPVVHLVELGDSAVNLMLRAWVKTDDYWAVYFETYEKIYETLPKRGISFPFPQLDVHMIKENN